MVQGWLFFPIMPGLKINMYTRRRRKSIYTRKYVYTLFTRWLWTCDVVDCQKEVQRCRDKKLQFMWSINHNVSNTVAHYSVHREERLLLSNWKGSVSWCTHSDIQSLHYGKVSMGGVTFAFHWEFSTLPLIFSASKYFR